MKNFNSRTQEMKTKMNKNKINFQNQAALVPVLKVINEANEAVNNQSRTIANSDMSEVLGGAIGSSAGAGLSFAALYALGTTGLSAAGITSALATAGSVVAGGMVAGVFVLAAPVALLAAGGVYYASKRNKKRLVQTKEKILMDAIRARDAVICRLQEESNENKDRIDELVALNNLLQAAIKNLQEDIRSAA